MKKLQLIYCLIFFYTGDFICKIFLRFDLLTPILYPIYNWCMIVSSNINDKYGLTIWEKSNENN